MRSASAAASVDLPDAAGPATTIVRRPAHRPAEAVGEDQQALRLDDGPLGSRALLLRRAQVGDLGAHLGAIAREPGEQGVVAGIAARIAVRADEPRGEVRTPGGVQVHHQEREVRGDVDAAQLVVELDAVDDREAVVLEQHVIEAQVTVTVADPAELRPLVELPAPRREHRGVQSRGAGDQSLIAVAARECAQRRHRVVGPAAQRLGPVSADGDRRPLVELREADPEPVDRGRIGRAAREAGGERVGLVVAAHLDDVLDRVRVIAREQRGLVASEHEAAQASVDVGRERAVELDLGVAGRASPFERGEVEEGQPDRLLDLVGRRVGQQHPRGVRLAQLRRLADRRPHEREPVEGGRDRHRTERAPPRRSCRR